MQINMQLINWYEVHKRNLPWRSTKDPYLIWISEIMLQQTKVDQCISYYYRFVDRFPNVEVLANAEEFEVLKMWQGLGYYSRARNIHKAAKKIAFEYKNTFPNTFNDILKLDGIGNYTAAAIVSFAFKQVVAVVDGNVYRFLARYFGIHEPIDMSQGKKTFQQKAQSLIDKNNPDLFNQAIMEFGALQCIPLNPDCFNCIFKQSCNAYLNNIVKLLPVKVKSVLQRKRYFYYLVINFNDSIYIHKRENKDVWQGLYEYPLIERDNSISKEDLIKSYSWFQLLECTNYSITKISDEKKHQLTHQKIFVQFFEIFIQQESALLHEKYLLVKKQDFVKYPVSKLIEKYIFAFNNI